MIARAAQRPSLTSVLNGGRVVGFMLSRGRTGVEAFDAGERSLGVFPDAKLAHDALIAEMTPSA
jgi:hypothetical protein